MTDTAEIERPLTAPTAMARTIEAGESERPLTAPTLAKEITLNGSQWITAPVVKTETSASEQKLIAPAVETSEIEVPPTSADKSGGLEQTQGETTAPTVAADTTESKAPLSG